MSRILLYCYAALAAIGVTIALWWLIAVLFSFDPASPAEESEGTVSMLDASGDPQLECLDRTADLRQLVMNSKYCEQDADCAIVSSHGKSPSVFRCMIAVRRDVVDIVQSGFDQHRSCDIIENCNGFGARPVCRQSLCQLETTGDTLSSGDG